MGDWAESTLKELIAGNSSNLSPVHYGDTNQIAAGDTGFKEYYLGELEATRVFGKRPDLLVYCTDIAPSQPGEKASKLTSRARVRKKPPS